MSMEQLLALVQKLKLFDEGKQRQKESRIRKALFDREIEERVKAEEVSQELPRV